MLRISNTYEMSFPKHLQNSWKTYNFYCSQNVRFGWVRLGWKVITMAKIYRLDCDTFG